MIFFLLLFILSANAEKFCVNCKHFKPAIISHPVFAKCKLFPKELDNNSDFLVLGNPKKEYNYCSIARQNENMCGTDGKCYEKKCSLLDNLKKLKD
jgi:hypothetical protein